jgi:hypothetical protein
MTLQERQQKEIEALSREITDLLKHKKIAVQLFDNEELRLRRAKEEAESDPETYFKNIDEEE